jgi:hypothetical protein
LDLAFFASLAVPLPRWAPFFAQALAITSVEVEQHSGLSLLRDLFLKKFNNLIPLAEYSLDFHFG